jgi:hypothetical protein
VKKPRYTHHATREVERSIALAGWSTEDAWQPVLRDLLKERNALYLEVRALRRALDAAEGEKS